MTYINININSEIKYLRIIFHERYVSTIILLFSLTQRVNGEIRQTLTLITLIIIHSKICLINQ